MLKQKIIECRTSRSGRYSKQQTHKHVYCYSDWCETCSRPRTELIAQKTLEFLQNTPTYTWTTIILCAVTSVAEAEVIVKKNFEELARIGVECIGSYEIGDAKHSQGFSTMIEAFKYDPKIHIGVLHLHLIAKDYYKQLKGLYDLPRQRKQIRMGSDDYKDKPYDENVRACVNYYRKHKDTFESSYLEDLASEQDVYKCDSGELFILKGSEWFNDVMVVNSCGNSFINSSSGQCVNSSYNIEYSNSRTVWMKNTKHEISSEHDEQNRLKPRNNVKTMKQFMLEVHQKLEKIKNV